MCDCEKESCNGCSTQQEEIPKHVEYYVVKMQETETEKSIEYIEKKRQMILKSTTLSMIGKPLEEIEKDKNYTEAIKQIDSMIDKRIDDLKAKKYRSYEGQIPHDGDFVITIDELYKKINEAKNKAEDKGNIFTLNGDIIKITVDTEKIPVDMSKIK